MFIWSLSFIENWVKIGLDIKKKVERIHGFLPFDEQCTKLEIVSLLKICFQCFSLLIYFSFANQVSETLVDSQSDYMLI